MLKEEIKKDLKESMYSKDEEKTSTLRLLISAIKNYEIEKGLNYEATDEDIQDVIARELKKRKESVESYKNAGRDEAAEKEQKEIDLLSKYLPEQMGEEEVRKIVKNTKEEIGVSTQQDMGKLIGAVMPKVKGKADGGLVSKIVREELS